MVLKNSVKRIPVKIPPETLSGSSASGNEAKAGAGVSHYTSDSGIAGEKSSGGNFPVYSRVVFKNIYGAKGIRRSQNGHRLVKSKPQPQGAKIQNDHTQRGDSGSETRSMGSVHRFKGRLLPDSNSQKLKKVFKSTLEKKNIPIPVLALRPELGPLGIHQSDKTGTEEPPITRSSPVLLPGRLADSGQFKTGVQSSTSQDSSIDSKTRVQGERGEITTHSIPKIHISRDGIRPDSGTSKTYRVQNSKINSVSSRSIIRNPQVSSGLVSGTGSDEFHVLTNPLREITQQADAEILEKSLGSDEGKLGSSHSDPSSGTEHRNDLVDPSTKSKEGHISGSTKSPHPPIHRCEPSGVGCTHGGPSESRILVTSGERSPHKLPRTSGSAESSQTFQQEVERPSCMAVNRQLHSKSLPAEPGGDKILVTILSSSQDPHMGSGSRDDPISLSPSRETERGSRCSLTPGQTNPHRVDLVQAGSRPGEGVAGIPNPGSVCHPVQHKVPGVHLTISGPRGVGGGCAVSELGSPDGLRLPTNPTDQQGARQNRRGSGLPNSTSSTMLAHTNMVQQTITPPSRESQIPTGSARLIVSGSIQDTPQSELDESSRLATVKQKLSDQGISSRAARYIVQSRRPSTGSLYDSKWEAYTDWCSGRQVDPLYPTVAQLTDFFCFLFQHKKRQVITIKGYRSAIAHTFRAAGVPVVTEDLRISQLIAGFGIARPKQIKESPPWDLTVVLKALMGAPFEPLRESSLANLTKKTVFLLFLAMAARRSEVHALSVRPGHISFGPADRFVTLRPGLSFLAKNQKSTLAARSWKIEALEHRVAGDLPDGSLCPVRALKEYLDRTKPLRGDRERLFIPLRPGDKRDISRDTVAQWVTSLIRESLQSLGSQAPLGIVSHQVRALATSWALFTGASLEQVCRSAFWASPSTFSSFYLKDVSGQLGSLSSIGPVVTAQQISVQKAKIKRVPVDPFILGPEDRGKFPPG